MSDGTKFPNSQRGTSPAKGLDRASQTSWNSNQGTTSPTDALANKATKNPVPVSGNK